MIRRSFFGSCVAAVAGLLGLRQDGGRCACNTLPETLTLTVRGGADGPPPDEYPWLLFRRTDTALYYDRGAPLPAGHVYGHYVYAPIGWFDMRPGDVVIAAADPRSATAAEARANGRPFVCEVWKIAGHPTHSPDGYHGVVISNQRDVCHDLLSELSWCQGDELRTRFDYLCLDRDGLCDKIKAFILEHGREPTKMTVGKLAYASLLGWQADGHETVIQPFTRCLGLDVVVDARADNTIRLE